MAIINCHECNHEISDRALSCVKCGTPLRSVSESDPGNNNKFKVLAVISIIFNLIFICLLFSEHNSRRSYESESNGKIREIERVNNERERSFKRQLDTQEGEARQRLWGTGRSN